MVRLNIPGQRSQCCSGDIAGLTAPIRRGYNQWIEWRKEQARKIDFASRLQLGQPLPQRSDHSIRLLSFCEAVDELQYAMDFRILRVGKLRPQLAHFRAVRFGTCHIGNHFSHPGRIITETVPATTHFARSDRLPSRRSANPRTDERLCSCIAARRSYGLFGNLATHRLHAVLWEPVPPFRPAYPLDWAPHTRDHKFGSSHLEASQALRVSASMEWGHRASSQATF